MTALDAGELDLYREGLRTAPTWASDPQSLLEITTVEWAERCSRLLATLDAERAAREPLDAAWREAEAALPEGWAIRGLAHGSPQDETEWVAGAGSMPFWDSTTQIRGSGPTPTAALLALAEALRKPVTA